MFNHNNGIKTFSNQDLIFCNQDFPFSVISCLVHFLCYQFISTTSTLLRLLLRAEPRGRQIVFLILSSTSQILNHSVTFTKDRGGSDGKVIRINVLSL